MASEVVSNPQQARAAVEDILGSETFARSEQLRSFLRYVCERALAGHGREINEYGVGVEALGKPPDFAPNEDSSVRRSAYELRQKLQKFYDLERPDAVVRIELPKGSYTPKFVVAPRRVPTAAPSNRLVWILAGALVVSIATSVALAILLAARPALPDAAVRAAWRPLAPAGEQVLVSVGTNLHLIVRPYMDIVAEGLPKYPAFPELYPLFRQHRPLDPGTELLMHPVDNSTQIGHAQALVDVATTLASMGRSYQILPERSTSAPALRGRGVVLIADPQNSNEAAQALAAAPLTLEFDKTADDVVIRERVGNHRTWAGKRGADKRYTEVYGLISMLPGTGGMAGAHHMLVFSGITSVGTHGAAEYFSHAEGLNTLLRRFEAEGYNHFPAAYQVVVRCTSSDTLLLSTEYAAHRAIR